MTLDDHFRDQLSRGQPPLVALHNAAQAYAAALKQRDCSQYADETEAWSEPQNSEAVKLRQRIAAYIRKHSLGSCRIFSIGSQCQCPLCDLDRLFQLTRLSKESNESKDSEAVELLRESRALLEAASDRPTYTLDEIDWIDRVRKFLEGK